jgi:hypothetical protein
MCDTAPLASAPPPQPLHGKAALPCGIVDATLLDYVNVAGIASLRVVQNTAAQVGQTVAVLAEPITAPGAIITLSQFSAEHNGNWRVMPESDLLLLKICKCADQ